MASTPGSFPLQAERGRWWPDAIQPTPAAIGPSPQGTVFNVLGNENATETKSRAPRLSAIGRSGAKLATLAAGTTLILGIATAHAAGTGDDGYGKLFSEAKELGVAPKTDLTGTAAGRAALHRGVDALRKEVDKAKKAEPDFPSPESVGVSQSTLDSIAACESGGDPTIVDASGTYRGKYQFDMGTWASVGGDGDPAAAPEAEQDYRAALLMSRSGSSPWPVCG